VPQLKIDKARPPQEQAKAPTKAQPPPIQQSNAARTASSDSKQQQQQDVRGKGQPWT
jgi:hypothetical protein